MTIEATSALDGLPWLKDKVERSIFAEIGYACVFGIGPRDSTKVRIGYATDLRRTVGLFQVDCWRDLEIKSLSWTGGSPAAKRLKDACHTLLTEKGRLLRGDWFDLPDALLPGVLALASRSSGVPFLTHPGMLEAVRDVRERRICRSMGALA